MTDRERDKIASLFGVTYAPEILSTAKKFLQQESSVRFRVIEH